MRQLFIGLFLVLLGWLTPGLGQNLVPNPSFEDTIACPNATNQLNYCKDWISAGEFQTSPDYFNTCSSNQYISPPLVSWGDQVPKSGNSFAFVGTYLNFSSSVDYREYISCELDNSLIIGEEYFISFYVSLGGLNGVSVGTNKLGALFSTVAFDSTNFAYPINFAHIFIDSIITDTINWYHFKQSFIADSSYSFITIGNFFDDLNTDTVMLDTNAFASGYFIDDVCVSNDSSLCYLQTHLIEFSPSQLLIYPNPVQDFMNVSDALDDFKIYNYNGEEMLIVSDIKNGIVRINCANWPNGIYILLTKSKFSYKFLIQH